MPGLKASPFLDMAVRLKLPYLGCAIPSLAACRTGHMRSLFKGAALHMQPRYYLSTLCQQPHVGHGRPAPEQAAGAEQMQRKDTSLCTVQPAYGIGLHQRVQTRNGGRHAHVQERTPSLSDWPALLQVPDRQLAFGIPGQGQPCATS